MPVRHALRRDLASVADVWVDAFAGDPYLRWIAPDDETYRSFGQAWLSMIAGLAFERGHTYVDLAATVAVAWIPPDLSLVTPADFERAREIIADHAGEDRADAAVSTILTARAHAIDEPHWTLQYIGVRESARGRGLGAAVVAPMLQRCDEEAVPCGLVSTNPRNVTFYRRLGFETVAEVPTPDGAATLRPMHRR
jgi:GNAT superfamily N-acetyltransferase